MISLAQLRKLSKTRPLTAKEKAVLCYWDYAGGRCTLSGSSSKMSEVLLSFRRVFGDAELEALIMPMISEEQLKEFYSWTTLINLTVDYDYNSEIFINKFFSLLGERSRFLKTLKNYNLPIKFYSITLDREIDIQILNNEIAITLFMYYRQLVYVIAHHLLLSNAFDLNNDLLCTKSLTHLTNIRVNDLKGESNTIYTDELIRMFRGFNLTLLSDHFIYIKEKIRTDYLWDVLGDEELKLKIIKSVEQTVNMYYPTKPVPKSKVNSIFSEIKKFAQSDV